MWSCSYRTGNWAAGRQQERRCTSASVYATVNAPFVLLGLHCTGAEPLVMYQCRLRVEDSEQLAKRTRLLNSLANAERTFRRRGGPPSI